ncbi:MAG: hypothetical protein IJQ67_06145 [Bacilli bacterium]|nr:hypothetical protein [Bacilli bacterium]
MAAVSKVLVIKRFAWQMVAREHARLGWYITNAEQETTTTYTHHYDVYDDGSRVYTGTTQNSKVRIYLSMVRDLDWYVNGRRILPFDILFTICFYLRRVMGFITPLVFIPFIILLLIGSSGTDVGQTFTAIFFSCLGSWLFLLISEFIFSLIGGSILRKGEENRYY